jgi:hypothetical protein
MECTGTNGTDAFVRVKIFNYIKTNGGVLSISAFTDIYAPTVPANLVGTALTIALNGSGGVNLQVKDATGFPLTLKMVYKLSLSTPLN